MQYIKEINIMEAVIHVLDNASDKPILNDYPLSLSEETYNFLYKHIEKALNDEQLKYAKFGKGTSVVKKVSQQYLNKEIGIVNASREFASNLFSFMRATDNIPSCDLVTVSITTEYGAFIGIIKLDYVKNYTHNINISDNKVGIDIVSQFKGLPSSAKVQKSVFIRTIKDENEYDLLVLDKKGKAKTQDEDAMYGENYFTEDYLNCIVHDNDRDLTRKFLELTEKWTQNVLSDNAEMQEKIRRGVTNALKNDEVINTDEFAEDIISREDLKEGFLAYTSENGLSEVTVDKEWVEKKLKNIKISIEKKINLSIPEEDFNDKSKFEIIHNGDGSINMVIKNIVNYIQK